MWVDGNDDGQFSEVDIFAFLSSTGGKTSLSAADFADNFVAWRGTAAAENFGAATPSVNISAANLAYALGGNDTLSGELGADSLYGGTGDDSLLGGEGNEDTYGGSCTDPLAGGAGDDTVTADGNHPPTTAGMDRSASNYLRHTEWCKDTHAGGTVEDVMTV